MDGYHSKFVRHHDLRKSWLAAALGDEQALRASIASVIEQIPLAQTHRKRYGEDYATENIWAYCGGHDAFDSFRNRAWFQSAMNHREQGKR